MDVNLIVAIAVGLVVLYVLLKALASPGRYLWPVVYRGAMGALALWAVNTVGGQFGFQLGINPINALVAGFLGAPGLCLLVAVKYLLA